VLKKLASKAGGVGFDAQGVGRGGTQVDHLHIAHPACPVRNDTIRSVGFRKTNPSRFWMPCTRIASWTGYRQPSMPRCWRNESIPAWSGPCIICFPMPKKCARGATYGVMHATFTGCGGRTLSDLDEGYHAVAIPRK